ncbi:MAG: hypothetical protein PHG44_05695 [Lentisphaeria bacterium]|nr:hypothetical protein [Lentisphaeria bacterium]
MLVPQPKQASLSEERVELPFPASQYLTVRCQSEFLFASQTRDLIEKELNRDGEAKSAGQNCLVLLSAPSSEDEKDFFSKCENAAEAYILRLKKASIELIATKHAGFINAAMSARQLLCWKNDTLSFPLGELHDWPDFGVRAAARWTLCGEATRWALDYGEGPEAFLEFAQKELDFLMRHKVNAVYFDGFTLDAERFPGYARLVSSLNDYAALRNIRLVFGFYGIGFGGYGADNMLAEAHNFLPGAGADFNRKHYPDGEKYACCGNNPARPETRFNGTCRSNPGLAARKRQMIMDFVRRIRPRALYIHNEDLAGFDKTEEVFWRQRCQECRKKWPDDALESTQGGAAGLAYGFDVLCEAVAAVKEPDFNYDGARDCSILLTSPGYGSGGFDSEEEWGKTVQLWTNISKQMKYVNNVFFTFREQFLSEDAQGSRIEKLCDSIKRDGKGHQLQVFVVSGADLYLDDGQFAACTQFNAAFKTAGMIFNFNGLPTQNLQVLLNAMHDWSLPPASSLSFSHYREVCQQRLIPESWCQSGGLIEQLCLYLYGQQAAAVMKEYFLLGKNSLLAPMATAYFHFSLKKFFQRYKEEYQTKRAEKSQQWQEIHRLSQEAISLLELALAKGITVERQESVQRLLQAHKMALPLTKLANYVYSSKIDPQAIRQTIDEYRRQLALKPTSYFPKSGDGSLYQEYLARFEEIADNP